MGRVGMTFYQIDEYVEDFPKKNSLILSYFLPALEFAGGEHRLTLLLVFPLCAADTVDDTFSWLPFWDKKYCIFN